MVEYVWKFAEPALPDRLFHQSEQWFAVNEARALVGSEVDVQTALQLVHRSGEMQRGDQS